MTQSGNNQIEQSRNDSGFQDILDAEVVVDELPPRTPTIPLKRFKMTSLNWIRNCRKNRLGIDGGENCTAGIKEPKPVG